MRSGKPLLTQRAKYKGAEIDTPTGHFEIEWYEGGNRCRKNVGGQPGDAVKALAKQKLKLEAQAAGIVVAEPEKANGKRSLKQAVDEFLVEKRRTKAKKTYQALKQVLEQFLQICGRSYLEDTLRDRYSGEEVDDQSLSKFSQCVGYRRPIRRHFSWQLAHDEKSAPTLAARQQAI